jgi:tetratricopeptide (TPR) repeat protein
VRIPLHQAALAALAIFGATIAAYFPSMRGSLLWDDDAHITPPRLQTLGGLWRIWSHLGTTQQYYPVLHSAFWVEHAAWGDSVLGYHLVNVALHATSACLFAMVLTRIWPQGPGWPWVAWLAAAVFALHPVCVESVAWISEQKNTLSLAFYLLSALAYLRFDRERGWGRYLLALFLFLLALLSKSVTATLPAAIVLLIALRRGRLSMARDAVPLLPWVALGACSGLFTAWIERNYIGAKGGAFELGPLERCFLAGRIVWFYMGKLLWPEHLVFFYPHWRVAEIWTRSLGCLGLALAVAMLWGIRKWSMAPLIAFLYFVGSLFPVLGFFNVYPFIFSYVADHFQYIACLGMVALLAAGGASLAWGLLDRLSDRGRTMGRIVLAGAGAALLSALFVLTWRQCRHYGDAGALYRDTLAYNPDCWIADNNLGVYLMERGSMGDSIAHLEHAVMLKPDYSDAHNNLGNALSKVPGGEARAITEFEAALRLEPGMAQAHANLGLALLGAPGRRAEGIENLREALRGNGNNPDYAQLHADLAGALAAEPGRMPEAAAEFEAALRLKPDSPQILFYYGIALAGAGRPQEAAAQLWRAIEIRPDIPEFHNNLGGVLALLGRGPEAIAQWREAVRLNPDLVAAHFNLGQALRVSGDDNGAIAELRLALRLAPGSSDAHYQLGLALRHAGRDDESKAEFSASGRSFDSER